MQTWQEVTLSTRPETVTLPNGEGHSCLEVVIWSRQHGCGLAVDMSGAGLFDAATELRIPSARKATEFHEKTVFSITGTGLFICDCWLVAVMVRMAR